MILPKVYQFNGGFFMNYFIFDNQSISCMASYFKFPISKKTEKKIISFLEAVKDQENLKPHIKEFTHIVNELIDEGMEYYFISTLKKLEITPIVRKPFELGITTSVKGLKVISPKILKTLSENQLKKSIEILEEMVILEA